MDNNDNKLNRNKNHIYSNESEVNGDEIEFIDILGIVAVLIGALFVSEAIRFWNQFLVQW